MNNEVGDDPWVVEGHEEDLKHLKICRNKPFK
jgi:hypothetical protein